jgi:hypothetical protein
MNSSNRRAFFKTAGVGAAAVGAAALVRPTSALAGAATPAAVPAAAPARGLPSAATGSMVAYIQDVSNGQVSVMIEGREVTFTDHQLVATLAHAMHATSKV